MCRGDIISVANYCQALKVSILDSTLVKRVKPNPKNDLSKYLVGNTERYAVIFQTFLSKIFGNVDFSNFLHF